MELKIVGGNNGHYLDPEYRKNVMAGLNASLDKRFGPLIEKEVICNKCGKKFIITIRKFKKLKDKYFCSKQCANSRNHSKETCKKISDGIKNHKFIINCCKCGKEIEAYGSIVKKLCNECKERIKLEKEKYMMKKYGYTHKMTAEELFFHFKPGSKESKFYYRKLCSFKFSLSDYPDEFDFSLIKEFGWYKPKNHGNNLKGISRDHMYSVMDGYRNNIDPKIISHPANCRLIRHNENIAKLDKSCITLDELLKRIDIWNKKYQK